MEEQGTRNHCPGHSVWVKPSRLLHSTEGRKSLIITNNDYKYTNTNAIIDH